MNCVCVFVTVCVCVCVCVRERERERGNVLMLHVVLYICSHLRVMHICICTTNYRTAQIRKMQKDHKIALTNFLSRIKRHGKGNTRNT